MVGNTDHNELVKGNIMSEKPTYEKLEKVISHNHHNQSTDEELSEEPVSGQAGISTHVFEREYKDQQPYATDYAGHKHA